MYRILYVDDEPALLDISRLFLERSGEFSVGIVDSAAAALTLLAEQKFDAIISDYQMPEIDGIEFLRRVRAGGSTIPFIIFTGRGREEIVIQALNEGADFYIQKGGEPVSQFAELAHKVRQAVQQRRAETSIRDHERREADIINFLPDATFAIDRSGRIIAWNRAIEEMTGFAAADMLGKGDYEYAIPFYGRRQPILIDLINEPDEVIAKNYAHIVREKDTLIADTTLPQPKGTPAILMGKAGPLYNQQGEIVGAIESIRDITVMKSAEEDLRESEGRFAAFMDHLPITAFIKDGQSTNLYVNRRMVEIFGDHDWIGKSVYEQFPKEAAEKMIEDDRQTIRDGYRKATEYLTDKDGRKRIYETQKFRIDRGDKPPLIGGFAIDISEQKEAEQALNKSELRFRELADLLPQVVYEADTAGNLTYANRIAFEQFGYTEEEFRQGLTVFQMVAPRDREREVAAFRAMVAGKRAGPQDEFLAMRKDGSTFPVSISSSPVLVEGRIAGLRGILVDITERKRAEDIVRESEEKYRLLFENANDAVFLNEVTGEGMPGRFIMVNPVASRLYGYSREEFLLLSIRDIVAPGKSSGIQEVAVRIHRDGEAMFEDLHRRKDGTVFPVEASIHIFELQGQNVGLSFVRDLTERKLAGDELREKEGRLKRAEEIGRTGSWVFHLSENLVEASEGARLLYGLGDTRWTIDDAQKIPLPEYRPLLDTALRDLVAGKKPYDVSFKIRRPSDGVVLDIHSVAEYDPRRNTVFGVIKDITELSRASDALSLANKKLKLLSGITRHDISNQLVVLQAQLAILEEKHPAVSRDRMIAEIDTTARRILSIVSFTKDYEGIGVNPPAWQDARSLVETAAKQVPLRTILLENDLPAGTEIFADPLIFRVFYNLMDNAVSHGGKITRIRFFLKRSDGGCMILCEDDGTGVAADAKETIFERDFRKTTGLALSLSREILSITGIMIRETGTAGKGARFEMVVPAGSCRSGDGA